jgi:hypothetical protein
MSVDSSSVKAATGFINNFKIGMGSIAVIVFAGIAFTLIMLLPMVIIHLCEKTTRFLTIFGCVVGVMVIIAAFMLPLAFRFSLLGYALIGAAVFTGFIYNRGRDTIMRIISVALFAAACVLEYWFY